MNTLIRTILNKRTIFGTLLMFALVGTSFSNPANRRDEFKAPENRQDVKKAKRDPVTGRKSYSMYNREKKANRPYMKMGHRFAKHRLGLKQGNYKVLVHRDGFGRVRVEVSLKKTPKDVRRDPRTKEIIDPRVRISAGSWDGKKLIGQGKVIPVPVLSDGGVKFVIASQGAATRLVADAVVLSGENRTDLAKPKVAALFQKLDTTGQAPVIPGAGKEMIISASAGADGAVQANFQSSDENAINKVVPQWNNAGFHGAKPPQPGANVPGPAAPGMNAKKPNAVKPKPGNAHFPNPRPSEAWNRGNNKGIFVWTLKPRSNMSWRGFKFTGSNRPASIMATRTTTGGFNLYMRGDVIVQNRKTLQNKKLGLTDSQLKFAGQNQGVMFRVDFSPSGTVLSLTNVSNPQNRVLPQDHALFR